MNLKTLVSYYSKFLTSTSRLISSGLRLLRKATPYFSSTFLNNFSFFFLLWWSFRLRYANNFLIIVPFIVHCERSAGPLLCCDNINQLFECFKIVHCGSCYEFFLRILSNVNR